MKRMCITKQGEVVEHLLDKDEYDVRLLLGRHCGDCRKHNKWRQSWLHGSKNVEVLNYLKVLISLF
jgi:hypothetical protein